MQAYLFPLSLIQYLKLWCDIELESLGVWPRTLHFY